MKNFKKIDGENITVEDGKVKELKGNPLAIANEIADMFNDVEQIVEHFGSSSLDFERVLQFLEAQKEKTEAIFKDEFQKARKREDITLNARRAYVLWDDITEALDILKAGGSSLAECAATYFREAMEVNNWENVN